MPFDFDALSTDPMFQMGIGIMGSNSPNFATAVGRGMQSGMMNVTEQRVERQNALFRQMQVAQYQAQVAAAQRAQVAAEQQRQQQEAAQQAYRGTIPQGQQALFDVAPGHMLERRLNPGSTSSSSKARIRDSKSSSA